MIPSYKYLLCGYYYNLEIRTRDRNAHWWIVVITKLLNLLQEIRLFKHFDMARIWEQILSHFWNPLPTENAHITRRKKWLHKWSPLSALHFTTQRNPTWNVSRDISLMFVFSFVVRRRSWACAKNHSPSTGNYWLMFVSFRMAAFISFIVLIKWRQSSSL